MVSLDGIRQFTLRELLALTDTYFHINGTVRFNKFDYVTVGLDNLKVSTVVDLDSDFRLEISLPLVDHSTLTVRREDLLAHGQSQFALGLELDLVYDLDLSLYECGDSDLGIAYTREDISIYIHNADFQKVLDEYYATQF